MTECYTMSCYDCIHCDRCSNLESGFSAHCADVSKCKHFRNKADFVEVVRCKDCKYNAENGGDCDRSYSYNCSCGERKEE